MRRNSRVFASTLIATLLVSGCAQWPARPVADASELSEPNTALVAFSVISSDPAALRQLDFEVASQDGRVNKVGEVYLPDNVNTAEPQVFLFRLPDQDVRFGPLAVAFDDSWWRSSEAGPAITAVPGEVTYLGRLELHSIRMARYTDSGRPYPVEMKLRLRDTMDEDLAVLAGQFPQLDPSSVNKAIAERWAAADFLGLAYWQRPGRGQRFKTREFMEDQWGQEPVGPELPLRRTQN